jgi:hypothetical protein
MYSERVGICQEKIPQCAVETEMGLNCIQKRLPIKLTNQYSGCRDFKK